MGSAIAGKMGVSMKENSKVMLVNQKETMLLNRQTMMAVQYSVGKERFQWFSAFYLSLCVILPIISFKTKKPATMVPLYPLSFVFFYQYDMFKGNKMERIRRDAEKMIKESPELFYPPCNNNLLSIEDYEKVIKRKD